MLCIAKIRSTNYAQRYNIYSKSANYFAKKQRNKNTSAALYEAADVLIRLGTIQFFRYPLFLVPYSCSTFL